MRPYAVDEVVLSSPAINGSVEHRIREVCARLERPVRRLHMEISGSVRLRTEHGDWHLHCMSERASLRVGIDGRAFSSPAAGVRRYVSKLSCRRCWRSTTLRARGAGRRSGAVPAGLAHVAEPPHPPTNLGMESRSGCRAPRAAPRST